MLYFSLLTVYFLLLTSCFSLALPFPIHLSLFTIHVSRCHSSTVPQFNNSTLRSLLSPFKNNSPSRHSPLRPVRMNVPGRHDIKPVALYFESAYLFSADPRRVPCNINFCNQLIAFQPIHAGVRNHAVQQLGFFLFGFGRLTSFTRENEKNPPFRSEENIASGGFPHGRLLLSGSLNFDIKRD